MLRLVLIRYITGNDGEVGNVIDQSHKQNIAIARAILELNLWNCKKYVSYESKISIDKTSGINLCRCIPIGVNLNHWANINARPNSSNIEDVLKKRTKQTRIFGRWFRAYE